MTAGPRVALVVGGTGRIGRAVVGALAARGFDVAVHCHAALPAARELAAALGGRSLAVTADLREEGAVRALVHRVADHFGRLDAVVLCAGRRAATPIDELTAADLRAHFEVNVAGGCVVAQEAAALMARQATGGAIVFVAAAAGPPDPVHVAAAATTASVPALARGLAAAYAVGNPAIRIDAVECAGVDPAAVAALVVARVSPGPPAAGA